MEPAQEEAKSMYGTKSLKNFLKEIISYVSFHCRPAYHKQVGNHIRPQTGPHSDILHLEARGIFKVLAELSKGGGFQIYFFLM